jgi:Asp-tRNA(Asn)/Glu-tRNA(Gln) amidotransferase A subunit family amidase
MADSALDQFDLRKLCQADGRAQQDAFRAGRVTRAELSRSQGELARTIGLDMRAFSSVVATEQVVARAASLDDRFGTTLDSPVDGLTFSVKGNIPVAGFHWTEGSPMFSGRQADQSAEVVQRVERAGAIFVGTTTLTALALYSPDNAFEPVALNPRSPLRTPGGSSAGAGVAAALGAAVINLGTDSGGSIRNPACHCGVIGFKPSQNRWPLHGVPSYAPSVDTLGVIVRSVADVIGVDHVVSGTDAQPAVADPLLVVPRSLIARWADRDTQRLFQAVVDALKARQFRIEESDEPLWEAAERAAGVISLTESAAATRDFDPSKMAPALFERLQRGRAVELDHVAAARECTAAFRADLVQRFRPGIVALTPTWPFRAPRIYQQTTIVQGKRVPVDPHRNVFVRAANAAAAPALTMPAGFYPGGLPFGIQLMGAPGCDSELLSIALMMERAIAEDATIVPK